MKKSERDGTLGLDRVMKRLAAEIAQIVREVIVREVCEIVRAGATAGPASRPRKPAQPVAARPAKRVSAKATKPAQPIARKPKAKPVQGRSTPTKPVRLAAVKPLVVAKSPPATVVPPPPRNEAAGTSPPAR
jgi:hypothetical protein